MAVVKPAEVKPVVAKPVVVKSAVSVGFGSVLGVIVAIGTAAVPVFNSIVALVENTATQWSSGEKIGLVSGAATAAIVLIGRFSQAVAVIIKGG